MFRKRFHKAVFMTATPFQLDVSELREVFAVFSRARGTDKSLMEQVDGLLAKIREYQESYDEFQNTWAALDYGFAETFSTAYDRSRDDVSALDDPNCKILLSQIDRLRELKENHIEPGFRRWMIRSLPR